MQTQTAGQQTPEQLLMTMRILWAAILSSSAVLIFLSYKNFSGEVESFDMINIFYGMAFMSLIASHVLSRNTFKQTVARLPQSATETQVLTAYYTSFILAIALSESVTLFGFISVTKTHEPQNILPFAAVGILNMLYFFPVKDKILEKAKALSRSLK